MAKKAGTTGPARDPSQQEAFQALIAELAPDVQELARQSRALVQAVMPGVIETVWLHQGTASYGTGPKKMSEHFVYFTFAKSHVGFGFYYGAELPDPEGLLEGTGKMMRRTKVASIDDLQRPALRELVEAASAHRVPPLEE